MRYYTDRYNQARHAGAKPLLYAYVRSDAGWRCLGKEMPKEEHLRTDITVFEWSARVLSFGDYRNSLSANSDKILESLFSQEMPQYTLRVDNADKHFTNALEIENFLAGRIHLVQGFVYPGFIYSDFQSLFYGKIVKIELDDLSFLLYADVAVEAEESSPAVNTIYTYSLYNAADTDTAASEVLPYETLEPWYELETWTFVLEIERTSDAVEETLLSIVNATDSAIRLEIGIDADDKLYLKYDTDIDDSTTTETLTGLDVEAGSSRLAIHMDPTADPPTVTFTDNHNHVIIEEMDTVVVWDTTTIATSISQPKGCTVDVQGNIYLCEDGAKMLQIYEKTGAFLDEFSYTTNASFLCLDEFENIYVSSFTTIAPSVRKYNSSGVLQWNLNTEGTGDGAFGTTGPAGVAISPNSAFYVVDSGNHRIQYFDLDGNFIAKWGNFTEFPGFVTDIDFDTLGNCVVLQRNGIIRRYTDSGVFINEFGSDTGSYGCYSIDFTEWGETFVADVTNDCIYRYDATYNYVETIASGSANFFGITSKNVLGVHTLYATDFVSAGNLIKIERDDVALSPDFSDNGADDTVSLLPLDDNTELMSMAVLNEDGEPVIQWQNVGEAAATDFVDQIGDADIEIIDGLWDQTGTIETQTVTASIESPIDAETEMILPTADAISDDGEWCEKNAVLPIIYGDLTENTDVGVFCPPRLHEDVYCITLGEIPTPDYNVDFFIYRDGVHDTTLNAYVETRDLPEVGLVTLLLYTGECPAKNEVISLRCKGRINADDELITDPIEIIEDFIGLTEELTGNSAWAVNTLSFNMAKEIVAEFDYTSAGVIQQNRPLTYWIKSILATFLGTYQFNAGGELEIKLPDLTTEENIIETIEEREAISFQAYQSTENLCTRIKLNYAPAYTALDARYKAGANLSYFRTLDVKKLEQYTQYGEYLWELDHNWTYHTRTMNLLGSYILTRYSAPLWMLAYTGQDCKFLPIDLLDQLEGSFAFFPGQTAICELREKTINLDDFTSSLLLQIANFEEFADIITGYVYIGVDEAGKNQVFIGSTDNPVIIQRTYL